MEDEKVEFLEKPISIDIESWFQSQDKDWIYEPKKLSNSTVRLSDKVIKFIEIQ
jgi:hypothetical protein